jgi:hypothetical protein
MEWLSSRKLREYYLDHHFGNVTEAEKQLYLAVIRGEVRARRKGIVLGPEWLQQILKMNFDDKNPWQCRRTLSCRSRMQSGLGVLDQSKSSPGRAERPLNRSDHFFRQETLRCAVCKSLWRL